MKKRMWEIGLVVLLIGIMSLGYGGFCKKKKHHSGSSAPAFWDVTVYVKDSTGGAPLGGMYVLIRALNNVYGQTTDAEGKARFPSISHDNHKVAPLVNGGSANGHEYMTWDCSQEGYPDGIDFTGKSSFTIYMTRIPGT